MGAALLIISARRWRGNVLNSRAKQNGGADGNE
jgi:hypothetical protein